MKATLEQSKDRTRVLDEEGRVLGEVRKTREDHYTWHSKLALDPYQKGQYGYPGATEREGLAHIGFKLLEKKAAKD